MCAYPSDLTFKDGHLDTFINLIEGNLISLTTKLLVILVQSYTVAIFLCVIICNEVLYQITHQGNAEYRDQRREEVVHINDQEVETQKPEGTTHGFQNLIKKYKNCECQRNEVNHISYLHLPSFKQPPILLVT